MPATALPRITNLAQAATVLDVRHAALVADKAALLAQASDALDCAEHDDVTLTGKADLIATARKALADVDVLQADIDSIEACWVAP
jgi:hypothetical protein